MMKKNIQIIASKKKGVKMATVVLSDELNIYTIENVKKELIDAFKKYDEIDINTKDVKNMDLTIVQLLHSILNSAKEKDKKVVLDIELNEDIKKLFDNTDLTRIIKK